MGYTTKATLSSGNVMVAGSFKAVAGSNNQFKLADIKGAGYSAEDGAWGELALQVLTPAGSVAIDEATGLKKVYTWHDNEDEGTGWFDFDGETQWPGTTTFDAGQSFWVQGEGISITDAGAVNTNAVAVGTPASGNVALGNPYPKTITLADISVSGYNDEDGAWGELALQVLTPAGSVAVDEKTGLKKIYTWHDNEDEGTGWFDFDGETKWPDTTSFDVGQGFWVQGEGFTVEFTYPKN